MRTSPNSPLWYDSNGNGIFQANDVLLSTGTYSNGTWFFGQTSPLDVSFPVQSSLSNTEHSYFLTVRLATAMVSGLPAKVSA